MTTHLPTMIERPRAAAPSGKGPVTRKELLGLISQAFTQPPTSLDRVLDAARDNHARQEVLDELAKVPAGERFSAIRDIWHHFPDMTIGD